MTATQIEERGKSIAQYVFHEARLIWETAGCSDDFCVQYDLGDDIIVFGGVNRVQWSVKQGFRADRKACTAKFLQSFVESFGERFF